jgi:tetratricopeptide (TPR) repeat protein
MDADTYSKKDVIEFSNANFVNVHLDGDKEKAFAKKLAVEGYPSTFVMDAEGEVVGRLAGYVDEKAYLDKLRRIRDSHAKLGELIEKAKASPDDLSVTRRLAESYRQVEKIDKAKELFRRVIDAVAALKSPTEADLRNKAQARAGLLDAVLSTTSIEDKQGLQSITDLIQTIKTEDPDNRFDSLDDALAAEAQILFAKKDFEGASVKVKAALEKLPKSDKADLLLYVLAMIQFETGKTEECKKTLKELIEKFPDTPTGKDGKQALEWLEKQGK